MTSITTVEQKTGFYADRMDGWISLSGGRTGPAEPRESSFAGRERPKMNLKDSGGASPGKAVILDCEMSFIFTTDELEIEALFETSPWAEK